MYNYLDKETICNNVNNAKHIFKTKLRLIAGKYFYNFKSYRNKSPIFSKKDLFIMKDLSKRDNLYITRPDKGNGVVLLNKRDYIDKMMTIINDTTKFSVINEDEQKLIIRLEDRLNNFLRKLKNNKTISETFYNDCHTSGSNIGYMYGLPKVHKPNVPLRPIVSANKSHNFNLSKSITNMLFPISNNVYSVINSKAFVEEIKLIDNCQNSFMCSLDIESLYTNIPVNETINIILDRLFTNRRVIDNGFNRDEFNKILELVLCDTYFFFNNSIYKQVGGLSMGSPISPIAANIFLCNFESEFLDTCPFNIKPKFYRRYLDDTFLLFDNENQALSFFEYINNKHDNIKFTMESEIHNKLSFLDVTIEKYNNKLITSVA